MLVHISSKWGKTYESVINWDDGKVILAESIVIPIKYPIKVV